MAVSRHVCADGHIYSCYMGHNMSMCWSPALVVIAWLIISLTGVYKGCKNSQGWLGRVNVSNGHLDLTGTIHDVKR